MNKEYSKELEEYAISFTKELALEQSDIPPEFEQVFWENFWEILA